MDEKPGLLWPTHFRAGDRVYRVRSVRSKQGLSLRGYGLRMEFTMDAEPDPNPGPDARIAEYPLAEYDPAWMLGDEEAP